ncbi:substrate-binding domain-containing protein [Haloarchaeobius sp. HRN-SO-5]|uniref:substrate-binding domain-containing protein n=1 Tax=Haloarchaeobius sp. HRN-SO-5 TaxID=3446118 RepID=UPI003EB9519E
MTWRQTADSFEYEHGAVNRRKMLAATGAAGLASLAGCSSFLGGNGDGNGGNQNNGGSGGQAGDVSIRYIPHGAPGQDPFWEAQGAGWDLAVEQLGVEASYQGPQDSSDFTQQVSNIETAIDSGVDAIAVTLPDPPQFQEALQRAAENDVYVIVTNVTETGEKTMPWHGYVGQNEAVVGEELATQVLPLYQETAGSALGGAVILNHDPGHSALALRQEGIEKVLDNNNITHDWIEVPSGDPSGVINSLASHYSSNEGVSMVFSLGPTAGDPAIDFIEEEGLQEELYHAGVDISADQAEAINEGYNLAQVIQQPALQAYLAAHYLVAHEQWGILTPSHTPTGPTFVHAGNVGSVQKQIDEFNVA